jgi:hypothetical protein
MTYFGTFWPSRCVYIVSTSFFGAGTGPPERFRRAVEPCAAAPDWGWTRVSGWLPKAGGEVRARAEWAWCALAAGDPRASVRAGQPWAAFLNRMGDEGGQAIEAKHERAHARGGRRSQPRANAIGHAPRRGASKKKDRRANVDPLPFVKCGDLVAVRG